MECNIKIKHGADPDSNFDRKQLAIGTNIELEHTDNVSIAKMIAKGHLVEIPEYYTYLVKMERQALADMQREKGKLKEVV